MQLTALAVLAAPAIAGPGRPAIGRAAAAIAMLLLALAWRRGDGPARSLTSLVASLTVAIAAGLLWQLAMAVALALHAALACWRPSFAPASGWRRVGSIPALPTAIVGGITPFALAAWFVLARPDLGDIVAAYLPDVPLPLLVAGGLGFALVNAVLEELVWRGVFTDALERTVSPAFAIAAQAVSFGLAHAQGFPRGIVGVVLAGSWAAMLGWLRRRSDGLAAPIVAHVVADASIATIVLVALR